MADYLSIDEAKARSWEQDVRSEINQVKLILKDAIAAQLEVPGENDSIMKNIHGFYTKLDEAWTKTCDDFVRSSDLLEQAISGIIKTAQGLSDEVEGLTAKIGFGGGNGGGGFR